jgi:hypothetical protein
VSSRLDIRDLPDRLEYRVTQSHTRTHLILRTLAWATGVSLTFLFAGESWLLAICLFGIFLYTAVTDIQKARRGTDVTLAITERDIISDGYTQDEYYPLNRWRIQAPDLSWKESHSTEDGPTYPHGVYCGGDCVLPLVSMEDGHRIVEQVYTRFPDTASESRYDGSTVPSPVITLGLSRD